MQVRSISHTKVSPTVAALAVAFSLPGAVLADSTPTALSEVTVTGTREARLIVETPNTVDTVSG